MADWPYNFNTSEVKRASVGYAIGVTSNASANTKSAAWVEVVASTPFDSFIDVIILISNYGVNCLLDVAIGSAGSEVIIANNLAFQKYGSYSLSCSQKYRLPVFIPSGTRISMKCQSTRSGAVIMYVTVNCNRIGGFISAVPLPNNIKTYGAVTGDSGGTEIDPGGTVDTKGAYVLVGTLTSKIDGLFFAVGNRTNSNPTSCWWEVDIAIGDAGSEIVIVDACSLFLQNTVPAICFGNSDIFWISLPSGTKVSFRVACNINDATDRVIDVILYTIG